MAANVSVAHLILLLHCARQVSLATCRRDRYGRVTLLLGALAADHSTMRFLLLLILLLVVTSIHGHPREMFLAGGAMHICSSLARSDCALIPATFETARGAARFRIDQAGIDRVLTAGLWSQPGAAKPYQLRAMLEEARRRAGNGELDSDSVFDVFDAICVHRRNARHCLDDSDARPWRKLLDNERGAVLSALEVPRLLNGKRALEVASLADSKRSEGAAILKAFVAAAATRTRGGRPLVAFVTASSNDTFDPVDFYSSALHEAGAEPVWWPLDAALAEAVHSDRGCAALADLRAEKLAMIGRERIFPDLVSAQLKACRNPDTLLSKIDRMQGLFFSGGDQWRLRKAFFDRNDQPYPWLKKLRLAYARGDLVIGGTSAGTAVQSGLAMLSNGESAQAMKYGAIAGPPPALGCARAERCEAGMPEDALSYWRAGGLALESGWVFDTHFSERARELRLLRLLTDSGARWGIGVDETSAVHLRFNGDHIALQALGAHGFWLFDLDPALRSEQKLRARVHYVAPGSKMDWKDGALTADNVTDAVPVDIDVAATAIPTDALTAGALRAGAQQLATQRVRFLQLKAGKGETRLERTEKTRVGVQMAPSMRTITDLLLEQFGSEASAD